LSFIFASNVLIISAIRPLVDVFHWLFLCSGIMNLVHLVEQWCIELKNKLLSLMPGGS